MSVNAAAGLVTNLRADVPAGLDFFGDANLTKRLGSMSKAASVYVVGDPISEAVEGGSRAILVNTGTAYPDGSARPTIVYVAAGAIDPVSVPPPAAGGDVDEAITERDKQWRDWLPTVRTTWRFLVPHTPVTSAPKCLASCTPAVPMAPDAP